jgi:hypothetical protein
LTHFKVFSRSEYKEVGFGMSCAGFYLSVYQVPDQLDGFYLYSVLKSLSVIGQCLVNMNILAPKIEVCQMRPKKQRPFLKKNGYNDFE